MNCLSLNVRGVGETHKVNWVRRLKERYNTPFVGLQETQLIDPECINVKGCWGPGSFEHAATPATGRSGGMLCIWDPNVYKVSKVIKSRHFLITIGCWVGIPGDVILANVYGPHVITEKKQLWVDLLAKINSQSGAWVVFGDFNTVRFSEERYNSQFCQYSARDFNSFIVDAGLKDVRMGGHHFTYFCQREFKLSKLDRFLISQSLVNKLPGISSIALPREISDHCPILLFSSVIKCERSPFRFFNSWIHREGFDLVVRNAWENFRGYGTPGRYLLAKLKSLKGEIRKWRSSDHPKEVLELQKLKTDLQKFDQEAEQKTLSSNDLSRRRFCMQRIGELEKMAALDIKQKARVKWLVDGDENTRFFHGFVNNKIQKNRIYGLNINGEWIADGELIKEELFGFFCNKFKEQWVNRPKLLNSNIRKISSLDSSFLESPFTMEEVKSAVWNCGSDKSPGPDGFTFLFLKKHWDLVKNDFFGVMKHFENFSNIEIGCNSSFITLIPKIRDPLKPSDFRPISLIGCIYKVISKTLANRLKAVIGKVIDEVQSAFVEGRHILEGPLIVNELCSWAKKEKKEMLLFKVDFEKAFDSVNWMYLDSVLMQMGFGTRWRSWISGCLRSARASVLVNGSPSKEFTMERGVRQGDPLSPFLFIIAMEGLNAVMRSACSSNVFTGIKIPRSDTYISHLFYAYDALFIGDWSISNIKNLARILRCFHIASGLKVNFTKSRIFGIGVDPTIVERWTAPLGCEHATLPFIYLGVPIGANMRLKKNWKPVVDRFREKLSKWKAKTLSFGGRLTLIKAVLGSLPTYYFSLFLAPNCVLDLLEKIRRNFLWGGSDEKRKISWISWDRIVDEKENGGLGVGSLKAFNRALLTKWWWRYRTDTPLLWVQVIQGIHNLHRKPANCLAKKSITGTWHSIASLETDLENYGVNLDDIFHKQVKDGNNTFFWWDKWIGDAPLKCLFPELYKLEKKKGCKVSDRLSISGPVWNWISEPINGVHNIELSNITTLLLTHSYASGADVWMCPLS